MHQTFGFWGIRVFFVVTKKRLFLSLLLSVALKESIADCASTHVKPKHTGIKKGVESSILCTSYNSCFLVLEEHPIHIPPLRSSSFVHSSKSLPGSSGSHSVHKDFPEWRPFPRVALSRRHGGNLHFSFYLLKKKKKKTLFLCDTFSLSSLVLQYGEEGDEEKQAGVFFTLQTPFQPQRTGAVCPQAGGQSACRQVQKSH